MLGDRLGHFLDKPLGRLAAKIPLTPNAITLTGFVLSLCISVVIARDLCLGALIILPVMLLDMLDGLVARSQGKSSRYGAFLDSVLDRYSDSAILLAIAWNLWHRGEISGALLSLIVLVGSLMISYVRARAEGLGISCSHGLMERTERLLALFIGAVTGYMVPVLVLLAVLTHFTVLQRIMHARRLLLEQD